MKWLYHYDPESKQLNRWNGNMLVIGQRKESSIFLGFSLVTTKVISTISIGTAFRNHDRSTFTERNRQ